MNININKFSFGKLYQPMNILKKQNNHPRAHTKKRAPNLNGQEPFQIITNQKLFQYFS